MSKPTSAQTPWEVRQACRDNRLEGFPSDALGGFLCVNIVMMHRQYADEFRDFCRANPVVCPLLHLLSGGETSAPEFARDLDIRTDLRSYDVIRFGENTGSVPDVTAEFTSDTVTFFIGSSVSLDGYLTAQGIAPSWGPCIYLTDRQCVPLGRYHGPMAVTMRSYTPEMAVVAAAMTARFPACHGAPVCIDNAASLGIDENTVPMLPFNKGGVPPKGHPQLFWACGVTPGLVARAAKLPLMVVHTPGNALITDIPVRELCDRRDVVQGL